MRRLRQAFRIVMFVAALLCANAEIWADTIVLKNGSRIVGSNITRENGKVSCETPAGLVTVPESIVAKIEKGEGGTVSSMNPGAANLAMSPPPEAVPAADSTAQSVIHDGAIDLDALARLDSKAASGSAEAVANAVAGEVLAGRFAFDHGDLDAALDHAGRALSFAPQQESLMLNVAYLHLRRGEYTAALDSLDGARRIAPDSADVAKLTGWADYGLNRLAPAVAEWKHAQQLRPDNELAQAIQKAEHEIAIEGDFREGDSAHFVLRYDGAAAPDLARGILQALESDFDDISNLFSAAPSEPIAVILYTNQAFSDITQAPSWVGALNDGRIRIPVQGLAIVTPELAHVLKHELAHSFINAKTHGKCPVWLQEGMAQWIEGKRSANSAAGLLALYNRQADPSLTVLDGSWMSMPADFAATAYAWSLAVAESIPEANGPGDLVRLVDRVGTEPSGEIAAQSVLHMSYTDLNAQAAEYLRRTYAQ